MISYLLCTFQGSLCVISFPDLKLTKTVPSGRKHAICALAAHPEAAEAVFADVGGHWGLLEEIQPSESVRAAMEAEQEDMEALFNDDEDDENSFSVAKVNKHSGRKVWTRSIRMITY